MLKRLIPLILSTCLVPLLPAALTDEDIIRIMDEKPIEGYDINPVEHGLPPTSSGFIILNYDQEIINGIFRILENPKYINHWKAAYIDLRRIASAAQNEVSFDRLSKTVESIEKSEAIDADDKVYLLRMGYNAIARHRNDSALEFLRIRTQFDFWEEKEASKTVYTSHGAGSEGILKTGQTEAISALDEIQTEEAYTLLKSLIADERYSGEPHLLLTLRSSLEYGWEASASRLQTIQAEYAKRLELRGASAPAEDIDEPVAEIPPTSPAEEKAETAEEATASEPGTEEPAGADTPEPSEEPAGQSSQSWLWLIGTVVVVGGIGLIARRKS